MKRATVRWLGATTGLTGVVLTLGCAGMWGCTLRGAGDASAAPDDAADAPPEAADVPRDDDGDGDSRMPRADDSRTAADAPVVFECDEAAPPQPDGLRRLSATQYANTITELVRMLVGDALEAGALVTMAGIARVPADRRQSVAADPAGGLRRLDQAVDQSYVDETFQLARALAQSLTTPERLARVVGDCAVDDDDSNDDACLTDFLEGFGARALRRPLDDDDLLFYRSVYGSQPAGDASAYADVITVLLTAPELLYFVEHGREDGDGMLDGASGTRALSAYELASRLSYHFWQTLPDDALWQAARDGSLLDAEVLEAQVQRLVDDPRTRTTLAELFGDMLALDELPQLDALVHDARFAAFAGDDLPGPELREQVIDDALAMLDYYTFGEPAGTRSLLTSERSFARGEALARIYGVQPWDAENEPPALPAGERPGLLTRGWLLMSGSAGTRPIRRGALVRRRLLCDELAPPPMAVSPTSVAPSEAQSTREAVEALTEQAGTACASCHVAWINPLGFALEGFDGLGRARDSEQRFDEDGAPSAELPIDTAATPRVMLGDARRADGPAQLAEQVLESGKLEACLARHYFRFAFGRREDLQRDGCVLERLRQRLVDSGRIRDMIAELGLTPELRQRTFGGEP